MMLADRLSSFEGIRSALIERANCFEGDNYYLSGATTIAPLPPLGSQLDWILAGGYAEFVWEHVFSSYGSNNHSGSASEGLEQWRWVMDYDAGDLEASMAYSRSDFRAWCLAQWGLDLDAVQSNAKFQVWLRERIAFRSVGEVLDLLSDILSRLRVRVRTMSFGGWRWVTKGAYDQSASAINSQFQAAAWRTSTTKVGVGITKVRYSENYGYDAIAVALPDDGATPPMDDNYWYGNAYLQAHAASLAPYVGWINQYYMSGAAPGDFATLARPSGIEPAATARPFGSITASTFSGITIRTGVGSYNDYWCRKTLVSVIDCTPLLTQTI